MASKWRIVTFLVFSVNASILNLASSVKTCNYGVKEKQFAISDWVWSIPAGKTVFSISFCNPQSNCKGAAVCKIGPDQSNKVNHGEKDKSTLVAIANDNSGFTAIYKNGDKCLADNTKNYTSEIYFICGKTLGNLEFVEDNGCTSIFEFTTSEVCKSPKRVNEIPCTIIDGNKKIRDLTQLVKVKGGHHVASSDVADFYINVCREITGEVAPGKNCLKGSSSCANGQEKGHIVNFSKLEMVNDYSIGLKYANITSGCSTNITFICPKSISEIGGRGPVMQSSSLCHYEIIWETEHACPVEDQVSNNCTIKTKDGTFDLSPLKRKSDYYKVAYEDPKSRTKYSYFLNICGKMTNFPCGKNSSDVAVCQTQKTGPGKKTGDSKFMKLRYVDGQLILTYKHGATCSSGIRRSTIITFYCNESSNEGTPSFNHEDYCNYFFDWPTSLVCPRARKTGNECRVITQTNHIYDLTELIKFGANNWHVNDATSSGLDKIYMNVCASLRPNSVTKNCPADNAVCIVTENSAFGLGKFESKLKSDTKNSLRLLYTNGSQCDGKKRRKSVVTFICHPGQLSNAPTLISKSTDDCDYEFIWQTAAACPLGKHQGTNCQVSDPVAGYSFDLTPLSNARPVKNKDYFSQLDSSKEYEYQIKICEGSSQTQCSVNGKSVGACQYKSATGMKHMIGEANSSLVYFDGLLKLTYLHGDKCHNGQFRETHITFICDETAGIGHPQFEKEVACGTYNFLWYTKHACLSKIVECSVFDAKTKKHYDLSKLSSNHGWQAVNKNRKYYMNVCRPLFKRPRGCSVFSAICDVQVQSNGTETFIQDLGSVSQSPTIESNGDLSIVYKNGGWCGKNRRITSKMRFVCDSDGGEGSPELDTSASDECNFVFTWKTSYACAVGGPSEGGSSSCMVQDPVSKYRFNLMPLRRSSGFYRVTNGADTFILNICGNVSGSGCNELGSGYATAACKFTGQTGKNPVIGSVSQVLKYRTGQITLEYSDGERQDDGFEYTTIITFLCNKNVPLGTPSFDHLAEKKFYFTFETSLACSPEPVQCRIAGPGNVMYNLEPLIKKKGYWTALNRETSGQKHHYFINVCQALDESPAACPKNAIAACQVDYNSQKQKGHSIGFVQSNPQVKNETLSIQYRNGEYCHHGHQNRSVRIFFHCSLNEGSPVFQTETKECGYIFNWLTPAACPKLNRDGTNCKVEEPIFKHLFDFSKVPVREISVQSSKFIINTCGTTECGNFGACLKSGTQTKNIGNVAKNLHLVNGDLSVKYKNGDINTKVKFVCDRNDDSLSFITNLNGKTLMELKTFEFEWKTPLACLPPYDVECSLFLNGKNEDELYDLSVLSRWDNNWRAHIDSDRVGYPVNRRIFINVCRNIVKRNGAEDCPSESGICMIRGSQKLNLGSMTRGPYKDGDSIVLEYSNGDVCYGKERFSAKIRITSNADQSGIGEPVLIGVEGCNHVFTWATSAANPINKQKEGIRTDCKLTNPVTGNVIDLNIFKDKAEERVEDGRGGYFMLKICSPFKDQNVRTKCGSNSGVCRLTSSDSGYKMNAGNFNQKVTFDKVLTLKYSDGDICPKCKCKRETIITFVCAPDEGIGHPILMSEIEECTQIFVWRTNHVCEREVQCTAFSNLKVLNIGHLTKSDGNFEISTASSSTKYYINICRNLVYDKNNPCPTGTAACKVATINGKRLVQNIGEITTPPVINDDKSVTLTYENGDACNSDKSKKWKTVIKFVCQHSVKGQPVFQNCDKCVCNFEWKTYEVCDEDEKIDESKCTVKDENSNHLYDLSSLRKSTHQDYKVNSKYQGISYNLNICGVTSIEAKDCSNSGVCRTEKEDGKTTYRSLGLVKYQRLVFDTATKALLLKYLQDADGTKSPTSIITFKCDELVGEGQPRLITDVKTSSLRFFSFHWQTSIVCIPAVVSLVTKFNGILFSLKQFSKNNDSFSTHDKHYTYKINFFGGIKDGTSNCPKTAAVCRISKVGDEVNVLAPASKQRLSANSTNIFINYSGGKGSCPNVKVKIIIKCVHDDDNDKKITLDSFDQDQCSYVFIFNSKLICKNDHSQLPSTKKNQISKKHPAVIAILVISIIFLLIILIYVFKNPERRANTMASLRFNCKKYLCCKNSTMPGYKYRKVQVTYGDEDIEEREGILIEEIDVQNENIYKDSESENDDDELLAL